jgi:hexosaminidase
MKLKFVFVIAIVFSVLLSINAQNLALIPAPNTCKVMNNQYLTIRQWKVDPSTNYKDLIETFALQIKACGIDFPIEMSRRGKAANLILKEAGSGKLANEAAYALVISSSGATLEFCNPQGLFYGLQTLLQITNSGSVSGNKVKIPCLEIEDQPQFEWRGLMLDESRHFFGKQTVFQLLDWMAFYKMNRLHWHLSDEAGWRVEIKKYPKLTEVGGIGNHTDAIAPAQYYTQEQIREIVKYASDRFIEVIPEIEMPGHAGAANRAYPEFSGGGSKDHPDFTFNPGTPKTYSYLTDIMRELAQMFPSEYIHLGGDEVYYGNQQWKENPDILALMKNQKLGNMREVENYFLRCMSDSLNALNKKMIGWDEIVDAGIPSNHCLVMWWRHDKPDQLKKALANGFNTILCPRIPFYFDFVQHQSHESGRRWDGAFVPLEKILAFRQDYGEVISKYSDLVVGVQANLWTETVPNTGRLNYLIFPRIAGVAEIGWSTHSSIDQAGFLRRLETNFPLYEKMNIRYFNPVSPDLTPEIK